MLTDSEIDGLIVKESDGVCDPDGDRLTDCVNDWLIVKESDGVCVALMHWLTVCEID